MSREFQSEVLSEFAPQHIKGEYVDYSGLDTFNGLNTLQRNVDQAKHACVIAGAGALLATTFALTNSNSAEAATGFGATIKQYAENLPNEHKIGMYSAGAALLEEALENNKTIRNMPQLLFKTLAGYGVGAGLTHEYNMWSQLGFDPVNFASSHLRPENAIYLSAAGSGLVTTAVTTDVKALFNGVKELGNNLISIPRKIFNKIERSR